MWQRLNINKCTSILFYLVFIIIVFGNLSYAQTQKPVLHGRHWVAITGKPLAATAGAKIFERGGNAVDATCAMLAANMHNV